MVENSFLKGKEDRWLRVRGPVSILQILARGDPLHGGVASNRERGAYGRKRVSHRRNELPALCDVCEEGAGKDPRAGNPGRADRIGVRRL
jgi:hypothetical protein